MSQLFPSSNPRRRAPSRNRFSDREPKPAGSSSLFGWSIFILLLIALVAVCWMGTIYIFGHPEQPMGYSVLHRFKKLEPPKRFNEIGAPKGEFLDAKKLYARYSTMTTRALQKESDRLLRAYVRNYSSPDGLVQYVTGRFTILDSYELTKNDFFQSGVVALAQDTETPQVLIENIYTTEERMVSSLYRTLLTGVETPINRSTDLAPIVHIEKLPDGRLKLTTIPIQYRSYTNSQGPGGFSLEPPLALNVEAGLPILSNAKVLEADRHYVSFRNKLARPASGSAPTANSLMPVRAAITSDGQAPEPIEPRAEPVQPATTPPPVAATTQISEPEVRAAIPVAAPAAGQAVAAAAPIVGAEVTLKPFMGGERQGTVSSTTNGRWQIYKPGQMPRGKLVGANDARNLAAADVSAQPLYLQGNFTVTAAVGSSAVLRSAPNDPSAAPNTRVVVQYPSGNRPPEQGNRVSRGGDRPFLITNIRQTPDGQVNIYVREVTSE